MPTNDQDARALTYLAARIRKETHGANQWDEAGIYGVVAKLVGQNLAMTVERVTRHAADPEAKTPGAINRPFVPEHKSSGVRYPPKRAEECRTHPGQYADSCIPCMTDHLAFDHDDPLPTTPGAGAAEVRAGIRGGL